MNSTGTVYAGEAESGVETRKQTRNITQLFDIPPLRSDRRTHAARAVEDIYSHFIDKGWNESK